MRLFPLLALVLGGCDSLDREAVVLMLDRGYRAEVLIDNQDGLSSPDGLLWSEGRLYIADEGGSAVRVWADGQLRTLADRSSGLSSPEDLALSSDGSLYVSDDDTGGLWRIGRKAAAVRLAPSVASSEGVAISEGGMILIGDPERQQVVTLSADGRRGRLTREPIAKAESFAFDGRGNLYIADNREQRLYVRMPDGRIHVPIADRGAFSPESLHHSGRGLFITDSENGKLHLYTPENGLRTIAVFGGTLANVQGIASDEQGNLYVSVQSDLEADRGYILRLTRQ